MPLLEEHRDLLDSAVADANNAPGNPGGTTAALFLQPFAGDLPWAHLDVAGPARAGSDDARGGQGRHRFRRAHAAALAGGRGAGGRAGDRARLRACAHRAAEARPPEEGLRMPQLINAGTLWKMVRAGHPRARLRATRDALTAIRLHLGAAALETGLLDALAAGDATTAELARRLGAVDEELLVAFLRVAASVGWVSGGEDRPWQLTRRGRAIVDDDLVRAGYEGFSGLHTAIYRDMASMLTGGPRHRDVAVHGALIARLSQGFEPLVTDVLTRTVTARRPRRVLDVGCGAGLELAAMLEAAPGAHGIGVDPDPAAADLAERTLHARGLSGRSTVVRSDVRVEAARAAGPFAEPFDLALLANVIYYLPMGERVPLLRDVAGLLAPGGLLLLVSTVATAQFFSRHFDLLLRSQEGQMQITDADGLVGQLAEAGFRVEPPRPIAPGAPVVTVTATLPG